MNIFHAIILGIVEGITEFLPISSTAHLEFVSKLLGIIQTDFVKSFIISIQLGAILAVLIIYWNKIFSSWRPIKLMIAGFIPTGIIGFLLYKVIKSDLLGNVILAAIVLVIGGIIMILAENYFARRTRRGEVFASAKNSIEQITYWDMFKLGIIQSIAVIPGVSRSGAVIVGGLWMGISRVAIVDAAFLLAIPTMAAATGYDLLKSGVSFTHQEWGIIAIGALVSLVVAYVSVKWLLNFVKTKTFKPFGWYRIVVGVILLVVFLIMK